MIDNRDQVERLLGKLTESLPLSALVTPALMTTLCERSSTTKITLEGGVMCHLTFDEKDATEVFLTSITHLAFDRRLPVAREIAAYQKHRIKRLRRGGLTVAPATHS